MDIDLSDAKKEELQETLAYWNQVVELSVVDLCAWKNYVFHSNAFHKKVCTREVLFHEISSRLKENKSFLCACMGHTEVRIAGEYLEKQFGIRNVYSSEIKKYLLETSGFFREKEDSEEEIDHYAQMTLEACAEVDILLIYASWKYYTYIANNFCSNAVFAPRAAQPYDSERKLRPWFDGLSEKKVLVVSSFSHSIEHQYSRKNRICKYPEWELPDFELKTFQMIETQFGNNRGYKNWFIAYNDVKERILNMDFDVAIIGAGAYGFPLSAALKKQGKMVIELCSYTTMMFGVVGQRHIDFGFKEQYGTDEWIRPMETPPEYYKKIEGGCYW